MDKDDLISFQDLALRVAEALEATVEALDNINSELQEMNEREYKKTL